jgi:hypothetical protein
MTGNFELYGFQMTPGVTRPEELTMNSGHAAPRARVDAIITRPLRLHVWCDASVDVDNRLAFGAFMMRGMKKPTVVKLKANKRSVDAEIETMTKALRAAPENCVLMTDLQDLDFTLKRWNYHEVQMLREAIAAKNAEVRYIEREFRSDMYRACHAAAIRRLRLARGFE